MRALLICSVRDKLNINGRRAGRWYLHRGGCGTVTDCGTSYKGEWAQVPVIRRVASHLLFSPLYETAIRTPDVQLYPGLGYKMVVDSKSYFVVRFPEIQSQILEEQYRVYNPFIWLKVHGYTCQDK